MSQNLIALQNKFLGQGNTLFDVLSRLKAEQGCISDRDIEHIAGEFHLPLQQVRSTAKFYDELGVETGAEHVIKLCNGEACRAAGYETRMAQLYDRLGVAGMGETSAAGVRLEHVTCLGYCGSGPNAMVDGRAVSLADPASVDCLDAALGQDAQLDLPEPENRVFVPSGSAPKILLRHFGADVVALQSARRAGIYTALEKALTTMTPEEVIAEVQDSRLRGRGGAGFPTGTKLETVRQAGSSGGEKFVVCNCDEGDAGSYIDKELIECDPHSQLEGILLAAYACGARRAWIYIRYEYPQAIRIMKAAIDAAYQAQLIGTDLFGTGYSCDIEVVTGQGAYVCGEETSLLRSIEGVPAVVGFKPPYPAEKGLYGRPTAVNNVETLHHLPWIVNHGAAAWAAHGHGQSRGTKLVSLNTRVKNPGLYEIELGITLRELIFDVAGGMEAGQQFKAVQVGGPLGGIFPAGLLDTRLTFEDMDEAGGLLGHAGIVVYSQQDDLMGVGRALMRFCAVESCGKCFPCRLGSVRGAELFDRMMAPDVPDGGVTDARLQLLDELCETMELGSLCALGGLLPLPIRNLMRFFPEEFDRYRRKETAPVANSRSAGEPAQS